MHDRPQIRPNLVHIVKLFHGVGFESLGYHWLTLVRRPVYVCKSAAREGLCFDVIEFVCKHKRRRKNTGRAAQLLEMFQVCPPRGMTDADQVDLL